ncbi:MAG: hypothetical protein NTNFB01_15700 [Nitrospira sp.]
MGGKGVVKVVVNFLRGVPSVVRLPVPVVPVRSPPAWSPRAVPAALQAAVLIVPSKAQGPV